MKRQIIKKSLATIMALLCCQSMTILPNVQAEEIAETYYYADLNGDEVLNVVDLALMKRGYQNPDSLTEIGETAFCGCENLTDLRLSNGSIAFLYPWSYTVRLTFSGIIASRVFTALSAPALSRYRVPIR